jgi:hypothetical protein
MNKQSDHPPLIPFQSGLPESDTLVNSSVILRLAKRLFLCLVVGSLMSCATVSRGTHDTVTVTSEPSRANVMLSSGEQGVTPITFVKSRRDNFTVTVSKPGYVAQTINVQSKVASSAETSRTRNVLLGGPLGVTVDAASGAYYSLYPNPVSVRLQPARKFAVSATEKRERPERQSRTTPRSLSTREVKPTAATSSRTEPTFPTAEPVPGKPGFVISPFDASRRYVDVSGYPPGSKAKDPWTDKVFIVP